jgi:hypothetical protein
MRSTKKGYKYESYRIMQGSSSYVNSYASRIMSNSMDQTIIIDDQFQKAPERGTRRNQSIQTRGTITFDTTSDEISPLSLRARRTTRGTKINRQHRTRTKDWVDRRREVSKNWKVRRDEISYSMQLQKQQIDQLTIQLDKQAQDHEQARKEVEVFTGNQCTKIISALFDQKMETIALLDTKIDHFENRMMELLSNAFPQQGNVDTEHSQVKRTFFNNDPMPENPRPSPNPSASSPPYKRQKEVDNKEVMQEVNLNSEGEAATPVSIPDSQSISSDDITEYTRSPVVKSQTPIKLFYGACPISGSSERT